jgi:hypothetical protein
MEGPVEPGKIDRRGGSLVIVGKSPSKNKGFQSLSICKTVTDFKVQFKSALSPPESMT